jgi:hypothetical protein
MNLLAQREEELVGWYGNEDELDEDEKAEREHREVIATKLAAMREKL